jgi:hypothetical protein
VIIKRGAFATRLGIVAMVSRDRVRLLLECFGGREIAVGFAVGDVEVISRLAPTRCAGCALSR